MRRLCILFFIFLWSVVIWAQQSDYRVKEDYQVKGNLMDAESGLIIDFADVLLFKSGDTKHPLQAFPDKKGEFIFYDVTKGRYTIMVRLLGYDIFTSKEIMITDNSQVDLGNVMLKSLEVGLAEVEVVPDYMMFRYRLKEYTLKKWGAWTLDAPVEGETRENESGTVYKYLIPEMCVVKIDPGYSDFGVETLY